MILSSHETMALLSTLMTATGCDGSGLDLDTDIFSLKSKITISLSSIARTESSLYGHKPLAKPVSVAVWKVSSVSASTHLNVWERSCATTRELPVDSIAEKIPICILK